MSKSQNGIGERIRHAVGTRAAAPVVCEWLEDRALFSVTTTVAVVDTTTTADSSAVTATTTDTKTSNGKGSNGYPHGKFGFW